MHVELTAVRGETFVGLIGFATDRYAILSPEFSEDESEVLGVPILKTKAYGTNLIGMFCTGNSNGILMPYFVTNEEMETITKFANGMGVKTLRIEEKYTALGNMIAANDKGAVISTSLTRDYREIEDVLGVEVQATDLGGRTEVGAFVSATNKGFLAHPAAEQQLKRLSEILKVEGMLGTVNCGIPYVKSGLIANSNGYITGRKTTGIELQRIDDALGFI
jgi:translation initiation factor 6